MTTRPLISLMGLCLCLCLAIPLGFASAEEPADKPGKDTAKAASAKAPKRSGMPTFKPTNLGSPLTRLGGATRSASDGVPRTEALVPEIAGYTIQGQPVIYWYLGGETGHRIDFTLISVDEGTEVVQTTLPAGLAPGIQRIALADHGVTLEPGLSYQWFVAIVPKPEQPLYNRIVGGGIEFMEAPDTLSSQLAATPNGDAHYVLAEAGIWYDALDALEIQIEASPDDASLIAQRTALFDQVGLGKLN